MTVTARKVLADLEAAHHILELETDAQRFRITWVAAMALCRSVGHALEKVDSKISLSYKNAINDKWELWKSEEEQNKIFYLFIENERNAVLKEYEVGFMSGRAAYLVLPDETASSLPDELFCPLTDGPYAWEDCRDVLAMAISWWHIQLREIDWNSEN